MFLLTVALIFISSIAAGLLGSLTGLGGGVVLTPVLVLFLGVPIEYAVGASLISTIATSASSGSRYLRIGLAHMRVAISLELGTTTGAIVGAYLEYLIVKSHLTNILDIVFGIVLIFSILPSFMKMSTEVPIYKEKVPTLSQKLKHYGSYYDEALKMEVRYYGVRYYFGLLGMFIAGLISGLLGIGSGALKVLAMDWGMNLPFKVTTATSSFMIGVTAATSAGINWALGIINLLIVGVAIPGIFLGATLGSKYLNKLRSRRVRQIFTLMLILLGIQLILRGLE